MNSLPQIKNQYYFYYPELLPQMQLDTQLTLQLTKVLRLRPKAQIVLQDGRGSQGLYEIMSLSETTSVNLMKKITRTSPPAVVLVQSLLKKDKTEWILQKATELGVSEIWLWESKYSEQTIKSFEGKLPRLQKIVQEAFEQSRGFYLPRVVLFPNRDKVFAALYPEYHVYLLEPEAPKTFLDVHNLPAYLLSGSEGGFDPGELKAFSTLAKLCPIKLSQQTLRAETASLAALAQLRLF